MQSSQQIIGVNDRLGNYAVANMQGTTRAIFDTANGVSNNFTFFQNVQTRPYPLSNISQNRFEVGESLAIESIGLIVISSNYPSSEGAIFNTFVLGNVNPILNLYIGNQRVIKDLDLSYVLNTLGQTNTEQDNTIGNQTAIFRLETPIIIPPQIEFYATLQFSQSIGSSGPHLALVLQGTGTLLNPKSNF
jgi:predicted choloylglycine hydrolase